MALRVFTACIWLATLFAAAPRDASRQAASDGPLRCPTRCWPRASSDWRKAVPAGARRLTPSPAPAVEPSLRLRIGPHGFDFDKLAQALPILDDQQRVQEVVVAINLELMQRLSGLPVKAVQFEDDLDRIIAHEVFGHAIPLLLAGHMAGHCADPAQGQRATDACAIKRENQIRKELKLGQRFDYGREGLALARRSRQE